MGTHTFVAFKWTGTGYNSTYNTSHTAQITDDDASYQGSSDSNETVSIDGGGATATAGQPYAIDVSFTTPDGTSGVETFNFFNTGGSWYFAPKEGSQFTEGSTLGSYQGHTVGWDYASVVCFAGGTLIRTDQGEVPVERLAPGMQVAVADGGFRPLLLCVRRHVSSRALRAEPKLAPIRIRQGALGHGLPARDLWVSRQHRMLITSPLVRQMFGTPETLIAAIRLTGCPGIAIDRQIRQVSYHHLVFDRHEVVYANGALAESFLAGPQAVKVISSQMRRALRDHALTPAAGEPKGAAARLILNGKSQRKLVRRHLQEAVPLVAAAPPASGPARRLSHSPIGTA